MPLLQRQIEPRYLGRQQLDEAVRADLGAVFVNSLTGVIRQLGSLSKHAEDLLSQIIVEIQKVSRKADSLHSRIAEAACTLSRLDPLDEQGETLPTAIFKDCIFQFTSSYIRCCYCCRMVYVHEYLVRQHVFNRGALLAMILRFIGV